MLWVLMVTAAVLSLANSGFAFQNEPDGFRDLKWGDPPTNDMEFIGEHPEGERGYVLPDEEFKMGDVLFDSIVYAFRPHPERLMSVWMYFDGEQNYDRLETICREKFGKTKKEKTYETHWLGPMSLVTLGYNPDRERGFLFFGSRMLLEDWLKGKEKEQAERVKGRIGSIFWHSIVE